MTARTTDNPENRNPRHVGDWAWGLRGGVVGLVATLLGPIGLPVVGVVVYLVQGPALLHISDPPRPD